jgi:hypothetical protein
VTTFEITVSPWSDTLRRKVYWIATGPVERVLVVFLAQAGDDSGHARAIELQS